MAVEMQSLDNYVLAVPLSLSQVEAANRLHAHLKQWRQSDAALTTLACALPGFDVDSTVLKVVSINALYGTNVFATLRMAEHVFVVMNEGGAELDDIDLVERLAHLPAADESGIARVHTSFASKFAHFFIDLDRFPIYDSYAMRMVGYHLGPAQPGSHREGVYRGFVAAFTALKNAVDRGLTNRQLDRYLWIAGQYREYLRNSRSPINTELRSLFETRLPECEPDLVEIASGGLEHGAVESRVRTRSIAPAKWGSKSAQFRRMYDEGLRVAEIARQTGSDYAFVYDVIKRYKGSKP